MFDKLYGRDRRSNGRGVGDSGVVSDDIWIRIDEAPIIERFQPLWNVLIEGLD